ncbi:hypothetical protein OIU79_022761 [Salix purpurea]|uniref:Uncharacterized protein n=1 Tax=Salix purpurea TaxID=77065 RepID=A0A9Q0WJ87_SALPP|nr:hypothetical protein OIU79_022761 [Salix purpurea]
MALSVVSVSINTASPCALNLQKLRRETTLPSWLNRSISSEHNKQGLNVVRVVRASCLFNPTNEPILKDALKEPVAFMGGMFAGLLRLDLKEDPLKEWVTRTVEASGITEEDIDAEGSQQEEQVPLEIEIE